MIKNPYEKIIALLDAHNIQYRALTHKPVYTSAEADAVRPADVTISQGAKALLLKLVASPPAGEAGGQLPVASEASFALFVLPGDRKLDMKKVRAVAGTNRIRFATREEVVKVMGCEVGACYPIGKVCGIKTYVDNKLGENHQVAFNAGDHSKSIIMKYPDYIEVTDPVICNITSNEITQ